MRKHAEACTVPGRHPLRKQAGNDASQQVTHAGAGHARVAEWTQGHLPSRIGDKSPRPLEHGNAVELFCQSPHRCESIFLDLDHIATKESRGLARMRGNH